MCQNERHPNQLGTTLNDGHWPRSLLPLSYHERDKGAQRRAPPSGKDGLADGAAPEDLLRWECRMRNSAPPVVDTVSSSTRGEGTPRWGSTLGGCFLIMMVGIHQPRPMMCVQD